MKFLWSTLTATLAIATLPLASFAASTPDASRQESTSPPERSTSVTSVDILAFQDAHEFEQRTWKDGTKHGGIAQLATVLNTARGQAEHSITAFGGDLAGGTLFGAVYRGEPFVDAFNKLGVDVAGFGQHDFDFGAKHTATLIERAQFPWISSNLALDNQPLSPDGTVAIVDRGMRVGFLSITGNMATTAASAQVKERDWIEASKEAATALDAQGVDAIIALTQLSNEETRTIMEAVPAIDAAITEETSGSSAATVTEMDGRPIVTPEADYGTVARLHLTNTDGNISVDSDFIPVNGGVTPDPAWAEVTKTYMHELDQKLAVKLGTAPTLLGRDVVGPIVAQAYREHEGTDFGWQNGGGIRAEIPAGDVTKRTVLSVLPFANSVISIRTTGEHLRTALEQAIASDPKGNRGFPRVAGLRVSIDLNAPEGQRVIFLTDDAGKPISPTGSYTLALTRYVYQGGDKVTAFSGDEVISADPVLDAEAFEEYVRKHGVLTPLDTAAPVVPPAPTPTDAPTPTAPGTPAPTPTVTAAPKPQLPVTGTADAGLIAVIALLAGGCGLALRHRVHTLLRR